MPKGPEGVGVGAKLSGVKIAGGREVKGWGRGEGGLYLTLHCHHQNYTV